jgi:hypothetical protein
MDAAQTKFDATRGLLVVRRESEGTAQLRVGESDDGAAAVPAAIDAARRTAAPEPR